MNQVGVGPGLIAGASLTAGSLAFTALVLGFSQDADDVGWLLAYPLGVALFVAAGVIAALRVAPRSAFVAAVVVILAIAAIWFGTEWDARWLSILWAVFALVGLLPVAAVRGVRPRDRS